MTDISRRNLVATLTALGAAAIAPSVTEAAETDAEVASHCPLILKAHAGFLAALEAESRATDRFYSLRGDMPVAPEHTRPSAWPRGVPIIHGEPIPTATEEEWIAYYASRQAYEAGEAKATRDSGLDAARREVERTGRNVARRVKAMLATRSKSVQGVACKLALVGEIVAAEDDEGCADILQSIGEDIEGMTGREIMPLAV